MISCLNQSWQLATRHSRSLSLALQRSGQPVNIGRKWRAFGTARSAHDLNPSELASHALWLTRNGFPGEDPFEQNRLWDAVIFQTQGLADDLSAGNAYDLLKAFSIANLLEKNEAIQRVLVRAIRTRGSG